MSSSAETGPGVRPPRPIPVIIGILLLADVVSGFESTMMFTALPRLIEAFEASPSEVSWVLTAFMLVGAASAAVCGRLGDAYGRRRVLIVLLLVSALGSIISVTTGTLVGVIIGRAVQGVAGGILPLCFGLAREHLPRKRVPMAVAIIAGSAMLAGASGNLIAGAIIDSWDWHYIFVSAAVVALLAAVACIGLPRSAAAAGIDRIDWLGAILFAPAIGLVLFGITNSKSWTWADPRTVGTISAGIALLVVWGWWELRVTDPMINLRLFFHRNLALTMLATAFVAAGVLGTTGFLFPLIMQSPTSAPIGLGLSPTAAGTIAFCAAILGFLLSPVSGWICGRAGARLALVIGAAFGIASAVALAILHATLPGIVVAALFLTVATSFMLSAIPNLIVESVPAENTSEATGVNSVARQAFSGVGASVATMILSASVVPGTHFGTETSYLRVFVLIGTCCLTALVLALFIRPTRRRSLHAGDSSAVRVH